MNLILLLDSLRPHPRRRRLAWRLLLLLLLPFLTMPARGAVEGDFEFTVAGGQATLTGYLGSGGSAQTTGIWLVRGLRLFGSAGPGQPEQLLLDERLHEIRRRNGKLQEVRHVLATIICARRR